MDMAKRFVLQVELSDGDVTFARLLDNSQLELFTCDAALLPMYIKERIALMSLCDINRAEEGEVYGRRTSDKELLIYISYDEYYEIKGVHQNV